MSFLLGQSVKYYYNRKKQFAKFLYFSDNNVELISQINSNYCTFMTNFFIKFLSFIKILVISVIAFVVKLPSIKVELDKFKLRRILINHNAWI